MRKRAAFITIGQSPRPDILDEMRPFWHARLDVEERGVLDGMPRDAIDDLAPGPGEPRLVSRLGDGTEVVLRADAIHDRVHRLVAELGGEHHDFLVLLCTGRFDELTASSLLVRAGSVVDHGLEALASSTSRVGVMVPDPEQKEEMAHLASHASPYSGDRFDEAARELSAAELIVMHCMGYTAEHKHRVAAVSGRPVLLAREMVATAVSWLI